MITDYVRCILCPFDPVFLFQYLQEPLMELLLRETEGTPHVNNESLDSAYRTRLCC
jgi:hypothetical protein